MTPRPESESDPAALAWLRDRVDQHLANAFLGHSRDLLDVSDHLSPLLGDITRSASGGKRLRPAFCYWGWRAAIGANEAQCLIRDDARAMVAENQVLHLASSLEFLQASALIHDDIIDRSDRRRSLPSLHKGIEAEHRRQAWTGDAAHYGISQAILAGDLLLMWHTAECSAALRTLLQHELISMTALTTVENQLSTMRTHVTAGQVLEVLVQHGGIAPGPPLSAAVDQVLTYKSARYSVRDPLVIGATLGGADPQLTEVFDRLGTNVGRAFQLRDDLLGVFGETADTGKPTGDDIREGKHTALIEHALSHLDGPERSELRDALGQPDLTTETLHRVRALMTQCGSQAHVEHAIHLAVVEAESALHEAKIDEPSRTALEHLIGAATSRKA